ncbi:MAG: hypothetical protein ABEJ70_09185, partial [Halobacteriaceae archaeon]
MADRNSHSEYVRRPELPQRMRAPTGSPVSDRRERTGRRSAHSTTTAGRRRVRRPGIEPEPDVLAARDW